MKFNQGNTGDDTVGKLEWRNEDLFRGFDLNSGEYYQLRNATIRIVCCGNIQEVDNNLKSRLLHARELSPCADAGSCQPFSYIEASRLLCRRELLAHAFSLICAPPSRVGIDWLLPHSRIRAPRLPHTSKPPARTPSSIEDSLPSARSVVYQPSMTFPSTRT